MTHRAFRILMVETDANERLLARQALDSAPLPTRLHFVADAEQLLQYLSRTGDRRTEAAAPRPDLILLDLAVLSAGGREAIRQIQEDERLHRIPIVGIASAAATEDVLRCYTLGAASFMTRPFTFERLLNVLRALGSYWADLVALPAPADFAAMPMPMLHAGRATRAAM